MTDKYNQIKTAVDELFKNNNRNFIFVYTPPKVGSTTLVSSLRISLIDNYNIVHIHDEIMLNVLTGITNVTINEIIRFLADNNKKVYVIDVYRTPIERKISEFFDKISSYHFNNAEENINNYSVKRVTTRFNKLFSYLANGEHTFDKYDIGEPVTFDHNKKYTIQEVNNVSYIKLRLKDSSSWSHILTEIFKQPVVMVYDYQTKDRIYAKLYEDFKTQYKLPSNYYNLIEECKYLKFYYSDSERNEYLQNITLGTPYVQYTHEEYNFYMILCLENQHINDIQTEHYIDEGCICTECKKQRTVVYNNLKNGININTRIKHSDVIKKINVDNKTKFVNSIKNTHRNCNKLPKNDKFSFKNIIYKSKT